MKEYIRESDDNFDEIREKYKGFSVEKIEQLISIENKKMKLTYNLSNNNFVVIYEIYRFILSNYNLLILSNCG